MQKIKHIQTIDFIKQKFEEIDFLTDERKITLQIQINDLKEELKYIRNRANEKITIKDEFAGAWKTIISLSFLASLVLIVLKIIEAVRNMG